MGMPLVNSYNTSPFRFRSPPYLLSLCREKALEVRRLQLLGLLPRPEDFRPARNAQYPHHTVLRCTLPCSAQ